MAYDAIEGLDGAGDLLPKALSGIGVGRPPAPPQGMSWQAQKFAMQQHFNIQEEDRKRKERRQKKFGGGSLPSPSPSE